MLYIYASYSKSEISFFLNIYFKPVLVHAICLKLKRTFLLEAFLVRKVDSPIFEFNL